MIFLNLAATAQKELQTTGLKMSIGNKGKIISFYGNKEYFPPGAESYLIRLNIAEKDYTPTSIKWKGNTAKAIFAKDVKVSVKASSANNYLKFEVVEIENAEKIDVLFWSPFASTIDQTIGEYVGVVRNGTYALGYQSLL